VRAVHEAYQGRHRLALHRVEDSGHQHRRAENFFLPLPIDRPLEVLVRHELVLLPSLRRFTESDSEEFQGGLASSRQRNLDLGVSLLAWNHFPVGRMLKRKVQLGTGERLVLKSDGCGE
jgi:hypothetical protein